jgi:hypothetical protein
MFGFLGSAAIATLAEEKRAAVFPMPFLKTEKIALAPCV